MNKQNANQPGSLFDGLLQKRVDTPLYVRPIPDGASTKAAGGSPPCPYQPGPPCPPPMDRHTDGSTVRGRDPWKDANDGRADSHIDDTIRMDMNDWAEDEPTTLFAKPGAAPLAHSTVPPLAHSTVPPLAHSTVPPLHTGNRTAPPAAPLRTALPTARMPHAARTALPSSMMPRFANGSVAPAPTLSLVPPTVAPVPMPRALETPNDALLDSHPPSSPRAAAGPNGNRLRYAIGVVLLASGVGAYWAYPRAAKTTVVVTGSRGAQLDRFTVEIDGRLHCTSSPCTLTLEPGMHGLRAQADGYSVHEQKIAVTSGSELILHISLGAALSRLSFGPSEPGSNPPGSHPASGSAPPANTVETERSPQAPKNSDPVTSAPRDHAVEPGVVAGGPGGPSSTSHASRAAVPTSPTHRSEPSENRPSASETKAPEGLDGTCTLNVNSIPASNVLVDGRPYGSTAKVGISVAPGTHTVVFRTSDGARESQTLSCKAGDSQTIAARPRHGD